MKFKVKKGDNVCVIAGKDKGKAGIIKKVFTKKYKVVLEGINLVNCFNKKTTTVYFFTF